MVKFPKIITAMQRRADAVRHELYTRYDELNGMYSDAEQIFSAMHIPVAVSHCYKTYPVDSSNPDLGGHYEYLGLCKVKGNWRICHSTAEQGVNEDMVWTPIVECAAIVRVEAAPHVEALREEVLKSSEQFVGKVDDAMNALARFINRTPSDIRASLKERAALNGSSD